MWGVSVCVSMHRKHEETKVSRHKKHSYSSSHLSFTKILMCNLNIGPSGTQTNTTF